MTQHDHPGGEMVCIFPATAFPAAGFHPHDSTPPTGAYVPLTLTPTLPLTPTYYALISKDERPNLNPTLTLPLTQLAAGLSSPTSIPTVLHHRDI